MLDWLACTFVKTFGAMLCRLRPGVAVWLGGQLGLLAYWLQPKRTRIGVLNLRAAFDGQFEPRQIRRIIRACYRQMGAALVELLRLPAIDRAYVDRYILIEGRDHVEAAVASGWPVIFLTGHYGNWELSSIAAALLGYPVVALARAQRKFPRLYKLLVSYRESKGCTIVHKGGAMKRLITALDRRQRVGIVGDQASRQGIFVDFFGRPALFATGPFELARRKDAVILPFFIHRVRGPFHRVVVEPPITLSRQHPEDRAIRQGIEQFAAVLARHIRDDPSQWLWMHKRWKYTPARRVLVLSDGKLGHLKQSLAVAEALRQEHPAVSIQTVEVRYRNRLTRGLALLWSWWVPGGLGAARCLAWTLEGACANALLSRYADLIISCGSATAPVNLLWAAEHRAKSVVILNPAPLPPHRFQLVIAPRHDLLPRRANIIRTAGALASPLDDRQLQQARDRLAAHPKFRRTAPPGHPHPVIAVFIGGDTLRYELSPAFADTLIQHVQRACQALEGCCFVTTSRRTAASVEQVLAKRLDGDPRCSLLLVASRDQLNGTMEGMLGWADVAVVTGESISMVSEACASGRRVIVVEPPLRPPRRSGRTKRQRFLRELVQAGYVRATPVSTLSDAIRNALQEPQPSKRLDDLAAVRQALAKLL